MKKVRHRGSLITVFFLLTVVLFSLVWALSSFPGKYKLLGFSETFEVKSIQIEKVEYILGLKVRKTYRPIGLLSGMKFSRFPSSNVKLKMLDEASLDAYSPKRFKGFSILSDIEQIISEAQDEESDVSKLQVDLLRYLDGVK